VTTKDSFLQALPVQEAITCKRGKIARTIQVKVIVTTIDVYLHEKPQHNDCPVLQSDG
jgi:hypothetical protein